MTYRCVCCGRFRRVASPRMSHSGGGSGGDLFFPPPGPLCISFQVGGSADRPSDEVPGEPESFGFPPAAGPATWPPVSGREAVPLQTDVAAHHVEGREGISAANTRWSSSPGGNRNITTTYRQVRSSLRPFFSAQPAVLAPLEGGSLSCMSQLPHHLQQIHLASADYSCITSRKSKSEKLAELPLNVSVLTSPLTASYPRPRRTQRIPSIRLGRGEAG